MNVCSIDNIIEHYKKQNELLQHKNLELQKENMKLKSDLQLINYQMDQKVKDLDNMLNDIQKDMA